MALLTGSNFLGKELADALGLKHVRRLDFHIAYDRIATVKAEFYPEVDGVKKFPAIIRKFKLVQIKDDPVEVSELGDEVVSFQESET